MERVPLFIELGCMTLAEAASKGQEAQFINSFVGFLANNGIQTTTNAVTSIINGLLGGGTKKPAGT
jgi:hypothetical protein